MIYVIYASHIKKSNRFINTNLLFFFFGREKENTNYFLQTCNKSHANSKASSIIQGQRKIAESKVK